MKVDRFIDERQADWRELDALLSSGRRRRRRQRADAQAVLRLAALYRGVAADLAHARRRHPGDPVVARLESLVARGRPAVYAHDQRKRSPRRFFGRTYWVHVRERPGLLAVAWAFLLVPAALAAAWAIDDPGAAIGLVPGQFRGAVEPVGDTGMTTGESILFSSAVLTNNVQVTFLAFATGILFGVGTAVVVAYNGAILGAVAGGAIANGYGASFAEFVTAHGVIELSCIAVAAAAGMRMGLAIVDPGPLPRTTALGREARVAIAIILGTVPWVVLAGFIEGMVTRAGFGLVPGIVLGVSVGAIYWSLVFVRGRPPAEAPRDAHAWLTAAPAPSR